MVLRPGKRDGKGRLSSVRVRLLSIVAAALVPALVIVGVQSVVARQAAEDEAERRLLELADILAGHQRTLIDDT